MKIFYTFLPVSGKAFTEAVLKREYKIDCHVFKSTKHGKPYLENPPVRFNLTHSGKLTALAAGECEVGLDAAECKERNLAALSKRLTPAERSEDFFRLWTAKEAYVKYNGATLAEKLPRLEFRGGALYEDGAPVPVNLCFFRIENYQLALCSARPEPFERIPFDL